MSIATSSFISQLEAAATGKELNLVQFETLLDNIAEKVEIEEEVEEPTPEIIAAAEEEIIVEEVYKSSPSVENAMFELGALFEDISGVVIEEPKEEIIDVSDIVVADEGEISIEPEEVEIDPVKLDAAIDDLKDLFETMAGINLSTGEPIEMPEAPEIFDISTTITSIIGDTSKELHKQSKGNGLDNAAKKILEDTSYISDTNWQMDLWSGQKNAKAAEVVADVATLLEKHKNEIPAEEYKTLESDAVKKTVDYLNEIELHEYDQSQSMPLTGANYPIVSSPQFTTAVTGILRKMMATGPGSGAVEVSELDDIDQDSKEVGYVLAYQPNIAPTAFPYKWQAADTPPAGDIHDIVTAANSGLEGGANSGTVTLTVDASNLPALGAPVALTDYVVIYDADASVTKKVLVSNFSSGDITGVTAGTGLSGGGQSGAVTLDVEASQTQITALGTIGTGTWQGTAIANAYLGTGINATKLANGSVTNTELQYINSLSSNAQTQITNVKTTADAAASKAFAIAQAVALG